MQVSSTVLVVFAMIVNQVICQEQTEIAVSERSASAIASPNKVIDRSSIHHAHADPTFKGIWKKNILWKPRWVKTWQAKKVFVAVWKRMWGPAVINEWVPIAKPPPGWVRQANSHAIHIHHEHPVDHHHDIHVHHEHPVLKHTSYGVPIHS